MLKRLLKATIEIYIIIVWETGNVFNDYQKEVMYEYKTKVKYGLWERPDTN